LVLLRHLEETHECLRKNTLALSIAKLWKPEMLAKGIKNDEPDPWELLKAVLQLIMKILLLGLIQNAHIADLGQDLVHRKLLFIALD
jgi:hypothetical protein